MDPDELEEKLDEGEIDDPPTREVFDPEVLDRRASDGQRETKEPRTNSSGIIRGRLML